MPSMFPWLPFSVFLVIFLTGCSREEPPTIPEIEPISSEDAEINAAMEQARDTFEEFVTLSHDPDTEGTAFLVKIRIPEGSKSEDLWVNGVQVEEKGYSGIINESPMDLTEVVALEEVHFSLNQVIDWQYFSEGKIVGAYVIRVERSRMLDEERAEFDQLFPFPFD